MIPAPLPPTSVKRAQLVNNNRQLERMLVKLALLGHRSLWHLWRVAYLALSASIKTRKELRAASDAQTRRQLCSWGRQQPQTVSVWQVQ